MGILNRHTESPLRKEEKFSFFFFFLQFLSLAVEKLR